MKYDFQTHADQNKTIALTFAKAHAKDMQSPFKVHYCDMCPGEIHTNIICYVLHECLVNGWEKIWCVTLYKIHALRPFDTERDAKKQWGNRRRMLLSH